MKKTIKTSETRRKLLKGIVSLPLLGGIGIAPFSIGSKTASGLISKENLASLKKLKGVLPKGKMKLLPTLYQLPKGIHQRSLITAC